MNLQAQWQESGPKISCLCESVCVCGWVAHAWPQVVRRFVCCVCVCVCVCISDILCGQWGWGGCKPVIALASVVLQLIYWTARHRGGVKERPRPLRESTPLPLPPPMWNKTQVIWSQEASPRCFSHYQYATLDKRVRKTSSCVQCEGKRCSEPPWYILLILWNKVIKGFIHFPCHTMSLDLCLCITIQKQKS